MSHIITSYDFWIVMLSNVLIVILETLWRTVYGVPSEGDNICKESTFLENLLLITAWLKRKNWRKELSAEQRLQNLGCRCLCRDQAHKVFWFLTFINDSKVNYRAHKVFWLLTFISNYPFNYSFFLKIYS